jgi:hypothetical protein
MWVVGIRCLFGTLCVTTSQTPPEDVALLHGIFARITYREEQKVRRYLDPEVLRALWIYHVRKFLDEQNGWSERQRELLEEALTALASDDGSEWPQASEDFKRRASEAFTPAQVYAIFHSLSGTAPAER